MASEQNPPFLYPPGSPLMHPPLALEAARMYGFWITGTAEALQDSIDATLNAAASDRMRFHVLTRHVLLTFTAIEHAFSRFPQDRAKGWGEETDIVAWVLVARVDQGSLVPSGFYACPLHIWVDDCMALINGRELFGYPKYECDHSMPAAGEPAQRFSLGAKGFQPYAPDSKLAMHPLLEVTTASTEASPRKLSDFDALEKALLAGIEKLEDSWEVEQQWLTNLRDSFRFPPLNQVFLKQFPDAAGERAVYQAVVAAPADVQEIRKIEMLGGSYELDLYPFASFPLDQTLGWKLGRQTAHLGFHLDFDFVVQPGKELVNNSVAENAA